MNSAAAVYFPVVLVRTVLWVVVIEENSKVFPLINCHVMLVSIAVTKLV
jgi:hypothetical protein